MGNLGIIELGIILFIIKKGGKIDYAQLKNEIQNTILININKKTDKYKGTFIPKNTDDCLNGLNKSNIQKYLDKLTKKKYILKKKEKHLDNRKREYEKYTYYFKDRLFLTNFFILTRGCENNKVNLIDFNDRNCERLINYAIKYQELFLLFLQDKYAFNKACELFNEVKFKLTPHIQDIEPESKLEKMYHNKMLFMETFENLKIKSEV